MPHVKDIPQEWFNPAEKDDHGKELVVRPALSYWADAWRRLRKNALAILSLIFLVLLTTLAIVVPIISPHSVTEINLPNQNQMPNSVHWFGTDELGRDVFHVHGMEHVYHYLLG